MNLISLVGDGPENLLRGITQEKCFGEEIDLDRLRKGERISPGQTQTKMQRPEIVWWIQELPALL